MAPIGEPIDVLGTNPIFAKPKPFLPPQTPKRPPVNKTGPVLPRIKPPIIPPKPPSIGGVGGIGSGKPMPINVPGGGGINYGPDSLTPLQPPADNPFARTRVNPIQELPSPLAPPVLPDPRTNMNIETNDTEFGPVTISSPGFSGGNIPGGGGIDYGPGMGGGLIPPPQDFGFGPGIRPTEIIGQDGQFIGSAGVTPPSGDTPDDPISGGTNIGNILNNPTTPESVVDPVNTPVSSMPMGAIDPVLLQQQTSETLTDPLLRSLYFGTQDQPGFYQQLQQAGANLIGQDVPLQQTAGLTPLELLARQQAVAGIGGFEPFFQQNKDLIDQAIGQSRRAEALRDPYFQRAERQMQIGLGNELTGIEEARGITAGATDRFGRSLGRLGRQQIGATGAFGQRMGDIEAGAAGATDQFGRSLDSTQAGLTGQVDQFGNRLTDVEGLQRGATDQFGQGIEASQRGLETGVDQFGNRLTDVEGLQRGSTDQFGRRSAGLAGRGMSDVGKFEQGLTDVEGLQRGLTDQFGRRTAGIARRGVSDVDMFSRGLQDPESLLRGTVGGYDQGLTQQFYNPFEDRVVQQTIDDVLKAGDKQDIASRAREISSGAFGGSRARLGAEERRESLGKGLAQALGNIRSQGYQSAQQTGLGEFARQKQAERAAASGLSDIASQRLGAGQNLSGMLANLSGQQLGAQQSLAGNLGSMASQRLGAGQQLTGMLRGLSSEQLAAQQSLASGLGSMAGQRLGATRGLEEFRRSGAGQQLGAQQALSDRLSNIAGQRLSAGQNLAEFQRGTAGQQLASQQALQNLLQSSAGQQLSAQQQLGSTLRGLTGDQFGAQQQLASNLMGYGSASNRARQNLASGLLGIGQQRGAGAQQLGQSLAGFGQQIGGIGSSLDALRRGERGELAGYGSIGRGIAETELGRIYEQQVGQQMRPLGVLGQIGSMLPGYQASQTQIDSGYGMPTDPSAAGLGAAFSAYGALAPRQGSR